MIKSNIHLPEFTLVGLTARTNNKNEMNPETSRIADLVSTYSENQIGNQILHRVDPHLTYAVYTDFESDENGEYTYFLGQAVDSLEDQELSTFDTLTIPSSQYQKFTTDPGAMPDVVISAWQKIWAMHADDFSGTRKYIADFEVYDERAADPDHAIIDIYIGISG